MALRVLLADESSTIKKVILLALQDYGVDVKAVPIGLDVVAVAKGFNPDIIFVDVLLQKRSGYDVAQDIKNDSILATTPVVLMWSGFMELDEAKAAASKADRRLEKPFDAEILRNMVKELVPRSQGNILGDYLKFPPRPKDFTEAPASATKTQIPAYVPPPEEEPPEEFVQEQSYTLPSEEASADVFAIPEMSEREEFTSTSAHVHAEEFQEIPLVSKIPDRPAATDDNNWAHQDLGKFKIPAAEEGGDLSQFVIPSDLSSPQVRDEGHFQEITFTRGTPLPPDKPAVSESSLNRMAPKATTPAARPAQQPAPQAPAARASSPESRADQILREESRAVLERIAWQILPDLCERLVKEELNKLLKEAERSIQNE